MNSDKISIGREYRQWIVFGSYIRAWQVGSFARVCPQKDLLRS
jgi:hypothetical protein